MMGIFGKSKKKDSTARRDELTEEAVAHMTTAQIAERVHKTSDPHVDAAQLVREGVGHLQAGRWHDAISKLQIALASAPQSPMAHGYLTQAYARSGNGEAAIRHFEHFRKSEPATAARLAEQDPWLVAGREVQHLGTSERGEHTYESYACADPTVAKDFLEARDVDRPNYYVDVDTPDGIWGKDLDSLYQSRLPDWKTDLSLVECAGSATGLGDVDGIQYCVKGISNNFTAYVECGRCDHRWLDALRYQDITVVRCPSCGIYNKIDSHNFHAVLIKND
jgi:tetratricopeptide (TPR) repeat protein